MSAKVIHGDCLAVLPTLESESVDMICCDPPYNVSDGKKDIDRRNWDSPKARRSSVIKQDFGAWDKFTPEAFDAFLAAWITECARILKPGGAMYVFFTLEESGDIKRHGKAAGLSWRRNLIWRKTNPAPQFVNLRNYCSALEAICYMTKGPTGTFNGSGAIHNILDAPICGGDERTGHPTQKPLAVLEPLIQVSSNPGDLVFDPFAGSGSSLVAAKKLGRRALGIEQDPRYHALAECRLRLREPDDDDLRLLAGKATDIEPAPMPLFAPLLSPEGR